LRSGVNAPSGFIERVTTHLHGRVYLTDDNLITAGEPVQNIYFFVDAPAHLVMIHKGCQYKFLTLPLRSWFGDFQVLLGINSKWHIKAGVGEKNTGQMMSYELSSEDFLRISDDYPTYRREMLIRAGLRRAYFHHIQDQAI
jgi:hypothetical protein